MTLERLEVRFSPSSSDEQAIIAALDSLTEYGAKGRFLKSRLISGYVRILREIESIKQESDPLTSLSRVAASMDSGTYYALRALLYARTDAAPAPVGAVGAPSEIPAVAGGDTRNSVRPSEADLQPAPADTAARVPVATDNVIGGDSGPAQAVFAAPMTAGQLSKADSAPAPIQAAQLPSSGQGQIARAEIMSAVAEPESEVDAPPVKGASESEVDHTINETSSADVTPVEPENLVEVQAAPPEPAKVHDWSKFAGIAGTRGGS